MALLTLDQTNLHIEVRVGILEKYKPSKEIKKVFKDIESLKEEVKNTIKSVTGTDDYKQVDGILASDTNKNEKLKEYFTKEYNPKIQQILGEIEKINEEICPGYVEFKQKSK